MLLGDELRAAIRAAYEEARELGAAEDPARDHPWVGRVALGNAARLHPRISSRTPAWGWGGA